MTCQSTLALLEDFVDKELTTEQQAQIEKHITACDKCRAEYESAIVLKELLQNRKTPDPGQDYWLETTSLIRARTVDSIAPPSEATRAVDRRSYDRNAFVRSLVSVAASLVILFSALLLGSTHKQHLADIGTTEAPVFVSVPLEEVVASDNITIVTVEEKALVSKGMLLLGAPGILGRFAPPTGLAQVAGSTF
ncbi:MAG: zf-HC2 domain-containing protein [Candidatus Zixiibacteriota bacterium]